MKVIKLVTVVALTIQAGIAYAQSGDMKGMDMSKCRDMMGMDMNKCMDMMGKDKKGMDMKSVPMEKPAKAGAVYKTTGVVEKVDSAKAAVTFAHEPVKDLNWSAMTMTFMVKDKMLLDKLVVNKKVDFEFVKEGANYVVTAVK